MSAPVPAGETMLARAKNFGRNLAASIRGIRWAYAGIAFCLAVTLWYTVTVRDKVESWVDVQVVFKNAPDNLVISDGLINKISVRVRAAQGLSRSLTGRDAVVVVDLSSITRGSNGIAIRRDMLPFSSAYEVIEIVPPRILVMADTMTSREMSLGARFEGRLGPDFFVKSLSIVPPAVTVRGADALVSGLPPIRVSVPLALDTPKGHSSGTVAVHAPSNVAVIPPQVTVDIDVGVKTKQVRVTRTVTIEGGQGDDKKTKVVPEQVTIVAALPESTVKNEGKLAAITASVVLPPEYSGETLTQPVVVALPENATLVSVTPARVTVSELKQP